jgi:serine protease Do
MDEEGGNRGMSGGRVLLVVVLTTIITTLVILAVLPMLFGNGPFDFLKDKALDQVVIEAANQTLPEVVNIEVTNSGGSVIGSGFIIRDDGYILTNNHVVDGAVGIKVSLLNGSVLDARIIGSDPDNDLAVIKIDKTGLPVVKMGNSSGLKVGEMAVAMGSPDGFEQSVTSGIISGLHRNLTSSSGSPSLLDVIQTDAAINPGNSGGPLCNADGLVIGINTALVSQSGGYEGLGFAIPIDTAKPVAEQLIATGKVTHAWLGVSGVNLTPEVAQQYGLKTDQGALLSSVTQDSPASNAGLAAGDIIVEMDGQQIASMDDLILEIRKHQVGDKVTIKYYRNDVLKQTEAILIEKPPGS